MRARTKSLNPAGKKHKFGKAWMHEHVSDHWVHEAQRLGYRSRAAFKLIELAARDAKRLGVKRGEPVSVRSNGTSVELRASVNKRLKAGVARVADGHAGELHGTVEVSK